MRIQLRAAVLSAAAALFFVWSALVVAQGSAGPEKKKIESANDLPRFSYPISAAPSVLLTADDEAFNPLAIKVLHDIDSLLNDYEIEDKATLRQLYATRLNVQILTNDNISALVTSRKLKELEEKPQAQATSGLLDRPLIEARLISQANKGHDFLTLFREKFQQNLNELDWKLVQDRVKSMRGSFEIATPDLIAGNEKQGLDPAAAQSKSIDLAGAETMIEDRYFVRVVYPLKSEALPILSAYVANHNVRKPDIWAERDVTLTSGEKLTPVRIGIWDSGVDTSLYPGQVFADPAPGNHSAHGLAFDIKGTLYNADLQPLTADQEELYPKVVAIEQGMNDLYNGIDSPAAMDAKKTLSSMPRDKSAAFLKQMAFLGQYMHGTHVAGIAVRGNPAARIVVVQFYDSLAQIPFPPTVQWANKMKADFEEAGEYFKAHDVRVVNMSWGDDLAEFEQWVAKTSDEKDPAVRKQLALTIFNIWREAVEGAIRSAPKTLFVCAAGNSNSDTGFTEDVPPSLHLPNLLAVGAVDQAGEETSFTSYGDTVAVDANGFQVESYVPGGTKLRFSGTSMASPNVANLAGKLIALDPSLTPEETIDLIKHGADRSADGRRRLINPKATVELLKARTK